MSIQQNMLFILKYKQCVYEWDKTNTKHPIHTPHKYITRHDNRKLLHVVDAFHLICTCAERSSVSRRCTDLLQDHKSNL